MRVGFITKKCTTVKMPFGKRSQHEHQWTVRAYIWVLATLNYATLTTKTSYWTFCFNIFCWDVKILIVTYTPQFRCTNLYHKSIKSRSILSCLETETYQGHCGSERHVSSPGWSPTPDGPWSAEETHYRPRGLVAAQPAQPWSERWPKHRSSGKDAP